MAMPPLAFLMFDLEMGIAKKEKVTSILVYWVLMLGQRGQYQKKTIARI
jgi:hypothetical protein